MDKHITLVAVFNIGLSIMGILGALIIFIVVVGAGRISGDPHARAITYVIGSAIAYFLILVAVPGIIGGIGLLKRQSWARILLLVISVLNLIHFPFGTAVGIYTIWAMVQGETKQLLSTASGPQVI
jgi:hypothetical protein